MPGKSVRDPYELLEVLPSAHQIVVRAAYRALAGRYHPDNDSDPTATARMAELNGAYAQVGTPDRRAVYDALQRRMADLAAVSAPLSPPVPAPAGVSHAASIKPGAGILDFGRYNGWSIADIAKQNPDYLRWLSRHSSGIRYRRRIAELLDVQAPAVRAIPDRKRRR